MNKRDKKLAAKRGVFIAPKPDSLVSALKRKSGDAIERKTPLLCFKSKANPVRVKGVPCGIVKPVTTFKEFNLSQHKKKRSILIDYFAERSAGGKKETACIRRKLF